MNDTPDNKAIYDSNWSAWAAMKRFGPMSRHTQRMVLSILKKKHFSSLLDVGCGPGVFLEIVKKNFPGVALAGTDISSSAVRLARQSLPQADIFEIDSSKKTLPGRWDIITMIDVAEHIEDDVSAFVNIRSACAGHLLIVTLEGRMRDFEPSIGHVRNYAPGELPQKLIAAGYTVERYLHWGWPMYSPLYRNASKAIGAHTTTMTPVRRFLAHLTYCALSCNVPGKGDLVIALAKPAGKGGTHA